MISASAVIAHESAHAAAATVLGYPPSAIQVFADGGGYVDLPPELDHEDAARDFLLVALAGHIGGDEPDWPPAWPPSRTKSCDEKQVWLLADYLQLDKPGWHQLCAEAWRLASSGRFTRLETVFSTALEHAPHLDGKAVAATIGASMEHLAVKATVAETTDRGEFTAIAAAYSVDRDGEQIIEGAFQKTITRWQASGRVLPLHWNHKGDPQYIIGSLAPDTMRETGEGLYVEGKLDLDDSGIAREAWRSMKANRVALSFGYLEVAAHERSDGVRELREVDLFEVSIVPAPANPDTRIVSMKSIDDGVPSHTELERRLIEEGIIAPIVDPEIFEQERDLMLNLLAPRRNGDNPEKGAPPSDHEQRREAELLGVIPPDPVRVQARAEMLALLLGHDEPASNGATDKGQREQGKALGIDPRPIRVERFEV